jgi:hypothetical protein
MTPFRPPQSREASTVFETRIQEGIMRKLTTSLVTLMAALLVFVVPASAITSGQPDGGEHGYVGEFIFFDPDATDPRFDDPGAWFSCSGTLLDATVVVTAGHCTYGSERTASRPP